MVSAVPKRDAVCACLLVAAALLALASCGCDRYALVRMDIRQRARSEVRVIPVAELHQFEGEPIPAACVTFRDGRGVSAEEAVLSDIDGMVPTTVLIWGLPSRKAIDRLQLGFTCTKGGYHPVHGVFALTGFGWEVCPEGPDHTVLVFMTPLETATKPAGATEGAPPQ